MTPSLTRLRAGVRRLARAAAAASLIAVPAAHAGGPSDQPVRRAVAAAAVPDRYIVRFRDATAEPRARLAAIGGRTGQAFAYVRAMSGGAHVVRLTGALSSAVTAGRTPEQAARVFAAGLMSDPDIAYFEPDAKVYPLLVPNDSMYSSQWDLYEAVGGINMPAAWDITTGSSGVTVAVIDTGYRPHADLAARLTAGYDFIGDTSVSNDGDGRDADPSDPGDGGCGTSSTWHGTHVSGTIGAVTNNGTGIAGINWVSKILPARVLGVCGGYTSDIVDAMRWSAGIAVTGVPANPTPARVENLSLGGSGTCSATFQSAIDDVTARGTVVVVAAGNENVDAANTSPASCNNVITVAATNRQGGRASFSNFGAKVAIAAPGVSILSTINSGSGAPVADSYGYYSGTSMAAPHVTGVVSLMLSQNPSMTPAQVKTRLQSTARAFPTGTGSDCTTATCGAGILNAAAALTPSTLTPSRKNLLLQSSGATASASSVLDARFPASGVIDGEHRGLNWESGGGWHDATPFAYPDWVRIDLPTPTVLSEIDVYTLQDDYKNPVEPTVSTTFTQYGITAFDVQYWTGTDWATVPNGSISSNNSVWRKVTFDPIQTTAIRVVVNSSGTNYSRIVEIEGYNDATVKNVAASSAGAVATATSTLDSRFPPSGAIDGDHIGLNWEHGGGWHDATPFSYPDVLQIAFGGVKAINEIDLYTLQDNYGAPITPTATTTFSQYGVTDFDIQYWNGASWITIPGGTVNNNNLVWRRFSFSTINTNAIRINVRNSAGNYSRIVEVEAYYMP